MSCSVSLDGVAIEYLDVGSLCARRIRHLAAVEALTSWPKPVLMVWGDGDKMFPLSHARRLAETFPHGDVRIFAGSSTYVILDQPGQTLTAIEEFVSRD